MNITIGRYYETKSVLHGLDPRAKLIFLFVYIAGVFLSDSFVCYGIVISVLAGAIWLSKIPFGLIAKGLRGVAFILLFTVVINIFFTTGGRTVFEMGFVRITDEGILLSVRIFIRLSVLIMMSSVVTLTTTYLAMADAIESFLKPFAVLGVPAHEISMMITISLRFIPTLLDELEKIKLAQTSRGAVFDRGGIIKRAKSMLPLIIPLFISSFRRADSLSAAMEARCYRGGEGRTKYKTLRYSKNDAVLFLFMFFYIFSLFLVKYML